MANTGGFSRLACEVLSQSFVCVQSLLTARIEHYVLLLLRFAVHYPLGTFEYAYIDAYIQYNRNQYATLTSVLLSVNKMEQRAGLEIKLSVLLATVCTVCMLPVYLWTLFFLSYYEPLVERVLFKRDVIFCGWCCCCR